MKKQPGDEQSDPDDETEQANDIDGRKLGYPFFHQFLKIGNQTDGEKGEQEEERK